MEAEFWHQRWQNNELGFQLDEAHPLLRQYLPAVIAGKHKVFVPLCGKSPDLSYLAHYLPVIGAELSAIACKDFFLEQALPFNVSQQHTFHYYQSGAIDLWQGDFFALTEQHISGCNLIYDRAALIALPLEMRQQYVQKLRQLIPKGGDILLISLEYPQHEKQGPPFSVPDKEIKQLFAGAEITLLGTAELTGKGFARRRFATSSLIETVYRITLPPV